MLRICMCVCMYIYIYVLTSIFMQADMHEYVDMYGCRQKCINLYLYLHICMHAS